MSLDPERCEDYRLNPPEEREERDEARDGDDSEPNPFRVSDEEMSGGEP